MRSYLYVALLTIFLMACSANKVPDMTPEETKHIDEIMKNMTSRCIGRYLIDLPESFVLGQNPEAEIDGITISVIPMGRINFNYFLERRESDLQKKEKYGDEYRALLKNIESHPILNSGKIFIRTKDISSVKLASRIIEMHGWKDGFSIQMKTSARDMSEAVSLSEDDTRKTDVPEKVAQLLNLFERVRGLSLGEIPSEIGLCIPNGFISGPAIDKEGVSIAFDLKGTPDVYFQFGEHGNLHEKTTLLERTSQTEKEMKVSGTQTIRKGKQTFHDLPYEEWLMKGPTPDRVPGTMFMLHGNEVAEGAGKPFVTLELFNGFRVMSPPDLSDVQKERLGLYKELERASLSEAEAVALWDKIITSFRPRPGAF